MGVCVGAGRDRDLGRQLRRASASVAKATMFWFAAQGSTRLRKFTPPCSLVKSLRHERFQTSRQAFVTQSGDFMRAVDTKVLVRPVTRDDAKQTAAAEAFVSRGAWVSHLVLLETVWVFDSVFELENHELRSQSRCFSITRVLFIRIQTSCRPHLRTTENGPRLVSLPGEGLTLRRLSGEFIWSRHPNPGSES